MVGALQKLFGDYRMLKGGREGGREKRKEGAIKGWKDGKQHREKKEGRYRDEATLAFDKITITLN